MPGLFSVDIVVRIVANFEPRKVVFLTDVVHFMDINPLKCTVPILYSGDSTLTNCIGLPVDQEKIRHTLK